MAEEQEIPQAPVAEAPIPQPEIDQQPEAAPQEQAEQPESLESAPKQPIQDRAAMLFSALSKDPSYKNVIGADESKFKAGLAKRDISDAFFKAISKDPDYAPHLPKTADEFYSKINQKDNSAPPQPKSGVQQAVDKDNKHSDLTIGQTLKGWYNQFSSGVDDIVEGGIGVLQRGAEAGSGYQQGNQFGTLGATQKSQNPHVLSDEDLDKKYGGGMAWYQRFAEDGQLSGSNPEAASKNIAVSVIGSAFHFAPSLFVPGNVGIALAGYSEAKKAINATPEGRAQTTEYKEKYAATSAIVQTIAMGLGFPKIIKDSKVLGGVYDKITKGVLDKFAGKAVAEDISKEAISATQKFVAGLKKVGIKGIALAGSVAKGAGHGAVMMGSAQAGQEAVNAVADNVAEKPIFKGDVKSGVENVLKAAAGGAVFGGAIGGVQSLSRAFSGMGHGAAAHPETTNHIDHRSANSTPEQMVDLHKEIDETPKNGSVNPIDAVLLKDRSQKIHDISTTLPDHLTPEERTKQSVALHEINKAKEDVEHVKAKNAKTDSAFKNANGQTPEEEMLQHRVDKMEDERHEFHAEGKYKYFSDEHGKYFKQFEDEPPIEIEKGRYDFQKATDGESKVTKAPAEQNETTGKFEPYVAPLLDHEGSKVGEVKEKVEHKGKESRPSQSTGNKKPIPPVDAPKAEEPIATEPEPKQEEPIKAEEAPKEPEQPKGKYSSETEEGKENASRVLDTNNAGRFVKNIKSLSLTELHDLTDHDSLYRNIYLRDFKEKAILDEIASRKGKDGPGQEPTLRKGDLVKDDVVTYKDKKTGIEKKGVIRKVFNGPNPEFEVLHPGGAKATIKTSEVIKANGREFNPKNDIAKEKPLPSKEAPKEAPAPEIKEPIAKEPVKEEAKPEEPVKPKSKKKAAKESNSAPQVKELKTGDKVAYKDSKGVEREGKIVSKTEGETKTTYSVKDEEGRKRNVSPESISKANGADHIGVDPVKEKARNDLRANPKEVPEKYDPKEVERANKELEDTMKPCA